MDPDTQCSSEGCYRQQKREELAKQSARLAEFSPSQESNRTGNTQAIEAKFVTPLDPVIVTADGGRLPTIPIDEAVKLNRLQAEANGLERPQSPPRSTIREGKDGTTHGARLQSLFRQGKQETLEAGHHAPLSEALPLSRTNPLFPPLPVYGPPTILRNIQLAFFRCTSAVLSFAFLMTIVLGALFDAIPKTARHIRCRALLCNTAKDRPFYEEEAHRAVERKSAATEWEKQSNARGTRKPSGERNGESITEEFVPTEGGPDPLLIDIGYYARRVGLDAETIEVQTDDGFILELVHLFNPRKYSPPSSRPTLRPPDVFTTDTKSAKGQPFPIGNKHYPVLLIHGLLQSAGAFCCNDDDSLAFYLAKSGYDVWLGNNRCGFRPRHTKLHYGDPRMWAWNIRQMGVMDLATFISRVLSETGFPKLALVAHSQGTTQAFVALAKEQRPDLGEKISVFCALAPAAYAGPLIGKIYLKFMSIVSPGIFRIIFGIHAFIPLMMVAHRFLPGNFYGWVGYHVFSFLFNWSDNRWDRGLRNRMFQWAPSYVSSESMRWWLGRECFAKHKCILSTREEGQLEEKEDEEDDEVIRKAYVDCEPDVPERRKLQRNLSKFAGVESLTHQHRDKARGRFSWYDERFPPLALWVCGADDLVDGRRLLRRFDRGREPHVQLVHKKVIEGYEHLDVIWAMDAIEKVGKEVREVIWRTADQESRRECQAPIGCTKPLDEEPDEKDVTMMHSGGRSRMANINENSRPLSMFTERREERDIESSDGHDALEAITGGHDHTEEDTEAFRQPS
ncbi:Hypothetical protein R9X50_00287100 [Acrodontium crateriforme]|uniref:Partial AB-hydrolase lipase domain-containing protein n=1 Tax=Acrodontium crateriforme TaxID=150365 RepID=A0AAQ3M2C2_9PEZI|nr:Hypothetical protein R9X50_00287100 [Acrodontium crateriforme]